MRVYGLTEDQVARVTDAVGRDLYEGNLFAANLVDRGRWTTFVIRCHSSHEAGARRSARGRRLTAATWAAHRDVLRAMFEAGAWRVVTRLADYRRESFEDQYPDTYFTEVGPPIAPAYLGDL